MANGNVARDRLQTAKRSLARCLEGIERELINRDERETYTVTYLSKLNDVVEASARLEDQLAKDLHYA